MNATEAKELLDPIPAKDFITSKFSDREGKCCAVGHLVRLTSDNPSDYSKENCSDYTQKNNAIEVNKLVRGISETFINERHGFKYENLASVNNKDKVNGYNQKKPKTRVMTLLKDMIKAGL